MRGKEMTNLPLFTKIWKSLSRRQKTCVSHSWNGDCGQGQATESLGSILDLRAHGFIVDPCIIGRKGGKPIWFQGLVDVFGHNITFHHLQ